MLLQREKVHPGLVGSGGDDSLNRCAIIIISVEVGTDPAAARLLPFRLLRDIPGFLSLPLPVNLSRLRVV